MRHGGLRLDWKFLSVRTNYNGYEAVVYYASKSVLKEGSSLKSGPDCDYGKDHITLRKYKGKWYLYDVSD